MIIVLFNLAILENTTLIVFGNGKLGQNLLYYMRIVYFLGVSTISNILVCVNLNLAINLLMPVVGFLIWVIFYLQIVGYWEKINLKI